MLAAEVSAPVPADACHTPHTAAESSIDVRAAEGASAVAPPPSSVLQSNGEAEADLRALGLPTSFASARGPYRKRGRDLDPAALSGLLEGKESYPQEPRATGYQLHLTPWLLDGTVDDRGYVRWLSVGSGTVVTPTSPPVACDRSFIADGIRDKLYRLKDRFEGIPDADFLQARVAINPFEKIGRGPFLNRSAMKLVNLDYHFWLSALAPKGEPLLFVDICGGPGGFTEYLLKCCELHETQCHGWGITLAASAGDHGCDWALGRVKTSHLTTDADAAYDATPARSFVMCRGADGTGNMYSLANVQHFAARVLKDAGHRVHLAVADGGFSEARGTNDQELLMCRLLVSQTLAMLLTLQEGGYFVCKFFDCFTPYTASLLAILRTVFGGISIVRHIYRQPAWGFFVALLTRVLQIKPPTSRPASSERYIVCKELCDPTTPQVDAVVKVLAAELARMGTDGNPTATMSLIPAEQFDAAFVEYLTEANNRLAIRQAAACEAIIQFVEDPALAQMYVPPSRRQIHRCLAEWGVAEL